MNETDIPCSDCGTDLVERTVPVDELPVSTGSEGRVTVAVCPTCDARYYPERTVTWLARQANDSTSRGDS